MHVSPLITLLKKKNTSPERFFRTVRLSKRIWLKGYWLRYYVTSKKGRVETDKRKINNQEHAKKNK